PKVLEYKEKVLEEARKSGEVRTLMGRRRFVKDINTKNFAIRGNAERMAFNTVIQGTAADIIKKAMVDLAAQIEAKKLKSRMLLQVHDELVFEVEKSEKESFGKLVKHTMEKAVDFSVPLTVDLGFGASWGEAH
ncbi:MAG: DNA polymerase I, partial [Deltaproteobacteria bacterium]|nr:DNA polymerase I [Deltaproteobacteria bacterium]